MQNARCFLCGHKMLENGLCSNAGCVRSQAIAESKNSKKEAFITSDETPETQAESGKGA